MRLPAATAIKIAHTNSPTLQTVAPQSHKYATCITQAKCLPNRPVIHVHVQGFNASLQFYWVIS